MHIVEVAAITRGVAPDTLTYFSAKQVAPGTLVEATLRGRAVPALVLASSPVEEQRAKLRASSFVLKKLRGGGKMALGASLGAALRRLADYFLCAPGAALFELVPSALLKNPKDLPEAPVEAAGRGFEELVIQAPLDERLAEYRSLIREAFARRESILIVAPTIAEVLSLKRELSRGVAEYAVVLHGERSDKEALALWRRAALDLHPLLLIATPGFLALPRRDLSLIIVEREGARSYKSPHRPFLDARIAAREIARARRIRVLYGDLPLRVETLRLLESHDIAEALPIRARLSFATSARLIDMRPYRKKDKGFRPLSEELAGALRAAATEARRAFLYAARRGLNPTIICDDCGNALFCERCGRMVALHKTPSGNVFLCHTCGEKRSANEKCLVCGSWKLTSLGVGSELVEEAVRELLPKAFVFRIDQDSAKTHKKATMIAEAFSKTPAGILIGTERAIPYLGEGVDLIGVASLDSLFALPDYAADERVFALLARLRALARLEFFIQTREPGRAVFTHALQGTFMEFYREELAAREKFFYPPFSTLIRVSMRGAKPRVEKLVASFMTELAPWEPQLFPGMLKAASGVSAHILIKAKNWPDGALRKRLRALPPSVAVEVGAGSVLPS